MSKEKKEITKRSVQFDEEAIKKTKNKKRKKDSILIEATEKNNIIQPTNEHIEEYVDVKIKNKPSKRQLKKEKAEFRATEAREASKQIVAQKALNYISKWKHAKSEWKFEKLKQIWLMENLFNDKYVSDIHFATILEYFEGCVGLAKKQLINKAMEVIKKMEEKIENDETTESIEYKRARKLLQALSVET